MKSTNCHGVENLEYLGTSNLSLLYKIIQTPRKLKNYTTNTYYEVLFSAHRVFFLIHRKTGEILTQRTDLIIIMNLQ